MIEAGRQADWGEYANTEFIFVSNPAVGGEEQCCQVIALHLFFFFLSKLSRNKHPTIISDFPESFTNNSWLISLPRHPIAFPLRASWHRFQRIMTHVSNLETSVKLTFMCAQLHSRYQSGALHRGNNQTFIKRGSFAAIKPQSSVLLFMTCLPYLLRLRDGSFGINNLVSHKKAFLPKHLLETWTWSLELAFGFYKTMRHCSELSLPRWLLRAKHILVVLSCYMMIYCGVDRNNASGFNVCKDPQ